MPILENGKVPANTTTLENFVNNLEGKPYAIISASRYQGTYMFWDMTNAYVMPNDKGDDMFMVNRHNDIDGVESQESTVVEDLWDYITRAVDAQKSQKATILIERWDGDRFDFDNMRTYETLEEARKAAEDNGSDFIRSVNEGTEIEL